MRIKFLPTHDRQSFTINYLFEKARSNEQCSLLYSTSDNNSKDLWIDQTKKFCELRSTKTGFENDWNKNTMHLVISIHPDDAEKMSARWYEVMQHIHEELNIGIYENNSIAWLHKDKEHHHVHLLFSKADYSADICNDSNIGRRINRLANELDLRYELISDSEKTELDNSNSSDPEKVRQNEPLKSELENRLEYIYGQSNDIEDFVTKCKANGVYVTTHESNGKTYFKYNLNQYDFEISQSSLKRKFSYFSLKKLDRTNPKKKYHKFKDQKAYVRRSISSALNASSDEATFERILKEKYNIRLIKHSNSNGVFGYSFVQEGIDNPIEIKGSQVDFNYKKIQYFLNQNKDEKQQQKKSSENDSKLDFDSRNQDVQNDFDTYYETSRSSALLLPPISTDSSDYNEEDEMKRKRKRRKKGI